MIILSIISIFFRVIRKTQPWFIGYISSSAISLVVVYPLELYYGLDGAVFGMLLAQFVLMISSIIFYLSSIDRSKVHQ
jgi:Na+-driven multidrug efflux pump